MAKKKQNKISQCIVRKHACNCTKSGSNRLKSKNNYINNMNYSFYDGNGARISVRNIDTQSNNKNVSYPMLSKSQRNKKSTSNKSIISLYRKNNKKRLRNEKRNLRSKNIESPFLQDQNINPLIYDFKIGDFQSGGRLKQDLNEANAKYYEKNNKQNVTFKSLKHDAKKEDNGKKSLKARIFHSKDKSKALSKEGFKESEKLVKQKIFYTRENDLKIDEIAKNGLKADIIKNKHAKDMYIGSGDQPPRQSTLKSKILNYTCECKCKVNNVNAGDQTGEPIFEMKVDKNNMHVINADEIKNKVKSLGRLQSKHCICPTSRGVCQKGICETAKKNKQTNFDCRCVTKKNVIECSDQTCDSNGLFKRMTKRLFSQNRMESRPLFEVKLDPGNMNIVNTAEILGIFRKSDYGVCPNGICNKTNKMVNCKCFNKKIIPKTLECTEKTCIPRRKCNLSYLCSRVFSNCENSRSRPDVHYYKRRRRPKREVKVMNENPKERKAKSKPEVHRRNGLKIKLSKGRKQKSRDAVRTKFKVEEPEMTDEADRAVKKNNNKRTIKLERERNRDFVHAKYYRKRNSPFRNFIVRCLKRKHKRCKRKIRQEEKALEEAEKRAMKENLKKIREQEKLSREETTQWNCLTKFVSGLINLIFDTIKNLISAMFSLIFSPIRSLIYIKRRVSDPDGTLAKLINWIQRTWGNRSSKLSRTIKEIGALNIIADHFEDTSIYAFFADKGRTNEERALYEARKRKRKQRMKQRDNEARFGCRHILLTTLRKTPCLWCYYVYPDLYPACLNLISFMKNFLHIIIYLMALACWTPCIISFEVCRAFLCCFFCTG